MNLVYTAIYGGYDPLWQPKVSEGWEYKCFSNIDLDGGVWDIVQHILELDNVRASKNVKIKQRFDGYDNVLWVDGSIEIIGDLNEFIGVVPDGDLVISKHPTHNNLNQELKACIALKKDDEDVMTEQVLGYGEFPEYEFTQNNIILRRGDVSKAMDIWWEEVKNKSYRDQLSFGWAMNEAGQKYKTFSQEIAKKYFKWHKYHKSSRPIT